jgi:hypothetical protein
LRSLTNEERVEEFEDQDDQSEEKTVKESETATAPGHLDSSFADLEDEENIKTRQPRDERHCAKSSEWKTKSASMSYMFKIF